MLYVRWEMPDPQKASQCMPKKIRRHAVVDAKDMVSTVAHVVFFHSVEAMVASFRR